MLISHQTTATYDMTSTTLIYPPFSRTTQVSWYHCVFWILLKLRMVKVVMTTGAIGHAKLQSDRHHQQTNTQLFTGRMPFQCQSTECKGQQQHS